ncbi:MAG: (2Fe-2S)-binding protein [Candidatus Bathyarchaeia archaeon]
MGKKMVCRCEDLTEEDILAAIREGYDDLESLKRYTGFSTGPCEGKNCMMHILRLLSQATGLKPNQLQLTTMRPPIDPVLIMILAGKQR